VGGDISAPQLLSIAAGEYTDEARKAKVEGTVTVEAVFGRDGKIRDPRILTSLGSGLDEKAIEAVMHATARPGMKNGQPVSVRYKVEVSFRLPAETTPKAVTGTFQVVHEHLLGIIGQGCAGRLIIAGNALRFESSKHPQKFLREDISALDASGPGFTDRDRKHWKFHVESDQKRTRQEKSESNAELMKALDEWLHSK
jgi:TonB family protein